MENKRTLQNFKFDEKPHVMVVEARFCDEVSDLLLQGAKAELDRFGVSYDIHIVPGALEIPSAIVYAVKSLNFDAVRRRYDGYVALGCVIKGETRHDEIIGTATARSLQNLAMQHTLAIGNGILTCNTLEQAIERANPVQQDRGGAAAAACLRMIELKHHFRLSPKRRWVAR